MRKENTCHSKLENHHEQEGDELILLEFPSKLKLICKYSFVKVEIENVTLEMKGY